MVTGPADVLARLVQSCDVALHDDAATGYGALDAFFAEHAALVLNNQLVARGLPQIARFFRSLLGSARLIGFVLPVDRSVQVGRQAFIRFRASAVRGHCALVHEVMAFATLSGQRIETLSVLTVAWADPATTRTFHIIKGTS